MKKPTNFYFCIHRVSTRPLGRGNVITMDSGNYKNKNFVHDAHSIGVSEYHLQWVTKYRYETLLKESHYKDCETALKSAAERHGITIKKLGVMPDHVHMIVFLPPEMRCQRR